MPPRLLMSVVGVVAMVPDECVALRRLVIAAHHFLHQLPEPDLRRPSEPGPRFGRVSQQGFDLRRAEITRVDGDDASARGIERPFVLAFALPAQGDAELL